jgi:hypothetical protein
MAFFTDSEEKRGLTYNPMIMVICTFFWEYLGDTHSTFLCCKNIIMKKKINSIFKTFVEKEKYSALRIWLQNTKCKKNPE